MFHDNFMECEGLNKAGNTREISSRLRNLNPAIIVLIETRVKKNKAHMIRERMKLIVNFMDNYDKHGNGRLWVCWDENRMSINQVGSTDQFIHCMVLDNNGNFLYWLTAIYAHNQ